MSYAGVVRQEGFQLPSPAHTTSSASPSDTAPTSPPPDSSDNNGGQSSSSNNNLFMPHNISFLPEPFRKFPSAAQAHAQASAVTPTNASSSIDFADELASLIDPHPHMSSHERSTHSHSPSASTAHSSTPYEDAYRHNIFDISAPTSTHQPHHSSHHPSSSSSAHAFSLARPPSSAAGDIYHSPADLPLHTHAHFNSTLPALNSSMRYEPHPDPPPHFAYRHTPSPSHRSRSRSRAPSVGPTRTARRDRRANSISSHVSSTSPPPRPHPHAIVIPGRGGGNAMGGFFVPGQGGPNGSHAPGEYSLPTPDSLSHSFGFGSAHSQHGHAHSQSHSHSHSQHSQYPYAAPSSPYYAYNQIGRSGTPSMGISPSEVETLNGIGMGVNGMGGMNGMGMSVPVHLGTPTSSIQASSLPATGGVLSSSLSHVGATSLSHSHSLGGGASNGAGASKNGSGSGSGGGSGSKGGQTLLDPLPDTHLSEKRRRRRESHNAVERRRRDNINERIGELAGLIPGVLFECDAPLVMPSTASPATATSPTGTSFSLGGFGSGEDLFSMGLLSESGMHVLSEGMDGLPELPEEASAGGIVKKDPSEDGEGLNSASNGGIPTNGTTGAAGEQQTIKANKGMILRKSVEYIRYLQQLVSVQASRGRDLEERNRVLEQELASLRGGSSSTSTTSGSISGVGSTSGSGSLERHGEKANGERKEWGGYELESMPEDMEMEDGDEPHDHSRSRSDEDEQGEGERRGRQRARPGVKSAPSIRMMAQNGGSDGSLSVSRERVEASEGGGDMEM